MHAIVLRVTVNDADAATQARAIQAAAAYPPLTGGSAARDAYCATHWAG